MRPCGWRHRVVTELSRFPCRRHMYMPGSQTTRGGANPRAGGLAPIAFCCHDGIGTPDYIAFAAHNLACTHPCQRFAGHLAALTHDSGPVWDATPFTVMDSHPQPPAGLPAHRGSMAGLCAPLPTLRPRPRERVRTARGGCGLLLLHRSGLAPLTPCRSPGALACARLSKPYLTGSSPAFSATFTTTALYRRSLRWFETYP